jgi:hypothetical protein
LGCGTLDLCSNCGGCALLDETEIRLGRVKVADKDARRFDESRMALADDVPEMTLKLDSAAEGLQRVCFSLEHKHNTTQTPVLKI